MSAAQYVSGSVGGLPECRNCRRVFTRVESLKKHLKSGCPAKPATEAGPETAAGLSGEVPDTQVELPRGWAPQAVSVAAVSSEAKPAPITGLMQRPEFVALVQRDWKTVLRHPTHVAVPKERCVLCGQWCAAIKQHMRLMHPNAWNLKTDAEDRCHSLLLPADSPCKYCEQTHQQPRRHLTHCCVLFQASLAGLHANPPTQVPDGHRQLPPRGDGGLRKGVRKLKYVRKACRTGWGTLMWCLLTCMPQMCGSVVINHSPHVLPLCAPYAHESVPMQLNITHDVHMSPECTYLDDLSPFATVSAHTRSAACRLDGEQSSLHHELLAVEAPPGLNLTNTHFNTAFSVFFSVFMLFLPMLCAFASRTGQSLAKPKHGTRVRKKKRRRIPKLGFKGLLPEPIAIAARIVQKARYKPPRCRYRYRVARLRLRQTDAPS